MTDLIFDTLAECEAANDAISAMLPPDKNMDGTIAAVQVTTRWADPVQLEDGRWSIPAYEGQAAG